MSIPAHSDSFYSKTFRDDEERDVLGSVGSLGSRYVANLGVSGAAGRGPRWGAGALSAASRTMDQATTRTDTAPVPLDLDGEASSGDFRPRSSSGSSNLIVLRKASRPLTVEIMGALHDDKDNAYCEFLKTLQLYDVLPHVGKVVLFDHRLSIRKAFIAMVETGIRSAPVVDPLSGRPLAVLSQTDFLRMLFYAHAQGLKDPDLQAIRWWLDLPPAEEETLRTPLELTLLSVKADLLRTAEVLISSSIHRAPVTEPHSVEILGFVSLKTILRIIHRQIRALPMPASMRMPLRTLQRVGTWDKVHVVRESWKLNEAVELLLGKHLSSVGVMRDGKLVNVLTKPDIIALLNDQAAAALKAPRTQPHLFKDLLELTVGEALSERPEHLALRGPKDFAVSERDNLGTVLEKLVGSRLRAVYVTDEEGRPEGVVSVADVSRFLLHLSGQSPASPVPAPIASDAAASEPSSQPNPPVQFAL